MSGFLFIASVVAMLHVVALSFVVGPWHWKYLLVTVASAGILWIVLPLLLPPRRWTGLLIGAIVALLVQQAAFWLWRAKLGGIGWPLVQFASVHFLIEIVFSRMRRRRHSTFVGRGRMVNQRQ